MSKEIEDKALKEAFDKGWNEGYDDGRLDGYKGGHADGYIGGCEDEEKKAQQSEAQNKALRQVCRELCEALETSGNPYITHSEALKQRNAALARAGAILGEQKEENNE